MQRARQCLAHTIHVGYAFCVEDTSLAAQIRYTELLRAMPPYQRLAKAISLSNSVRAMARAGIRQRHPEAGPQELDVRLAVRRFGRAEAERIFGSVPPDAT
jgi:biotin carboxylase